MYVSANENGLDMIVPIFDQYPINWHPTQYDYFHILFSLYKKHILELLFFVHRSKTPNSIILSSFTRLNLFTISNNIFQC